MYVPKFNEEQDTSKLYQLIRNNPLGAWATLADGEIAINHIPFMLRELGQGKAMLVGHVAKANPISRSFSSQQHSVVVFQGEQAYITPSWYPSKQDAGKAVPTWNYVVVHAHGTPRTIEHPDWLLQHVKELTAIHEREQPVPWQVTDAPENYIKKLTSAIVGIEIPIEKLVGKWKLSQNRSQQDKQGVFDGLRAKTDDHAQGLAKHLEAHLE